MQVIIASKHTSEPKKNIRFRIPHHATLSFLISLITAFYLSHSTELISANELSVNKIKPIRIASATVASDEILWLILNKANATKRLIGLSILADNSKYSHLTGINPKIRLRVGGEIESLIAAKPDLVVLATFNRTELVRQIESLEIPTYILKDFHSLNDITNAVHDIAHLIGEPKAGEQVIHEYLKKINSLPPLQCSKKPKVMAWLGMGTVIGKQTLFDEIIKYAGGANATEPLNINGWPKINPEALMALSPDFLVVSDEIDLKILIKELKDNVSTQNWPAVINQKFIQMDQRDLNAASPFISDAIIKLRTQLNIHWKS